MRAVCLLLAALGMAPLQVGAREPVVTLRATVTGNQEQPRVMYILPWQAPEARDYEYTPAQSLADDLFRGLDRDEFLRELEYRDALGSANSTAEPRGDD